MLLGIKLKRLDAGTMVRRPENVQDGWIKHLGDLSKCWGLRLLGDHKKLLGREKKTAEWSGKISLRSEKKQGYVKQIGVLKKFLGYQNYKVA